MEIGLLQNLYLEVVMYLGNDVFTLTTTTTVL